MSVHRDEQGRTGRELAANLALAGFTAEQAAAALGLSAWRMDQALRVAAAADPVDVWSLRDYLDAAVLAATGTAAEWTILTDAARARASRWFALRTPHREPAPAVA